MRGTWIGVVVVLAVGVLAVGAQARSSEVSATGRVAFVENRGQAPERVRYYALGRRFSFAAERGRVLLSFLGPRATRGVALALRFPGREPAGSLRLAGTVNELRGS